MPTESGSKDSIVFIFNRLGPFDSFWGRLKARASLVEIIDPNHEKVSITDACAGLAGQRPGWPRTEGFPGHGKVPGEGEQPVTLVAGTSALLHPPHLLQIQRRCQVSVVRSGRPISREDALTGNSWLMDWLPWDDVFSGHEMQTALSRAGFPRLYCILPGEGRPARWGTGTGQRP